MLEMIGHDEALKKLQVSFFRGKLSHAYLINGPDGCGKTVFSKIMASIANCESNISKTYEKQDVTDDKAFCGKCNSCLKIEQGIHPDLTLISPEKTTIKIDQIREMQKSIYRMANEGRYKVYVIEQADRMTEEAQNSLLKILEEPLGETLILLTVENKSQILPTIISRCNMINLFAIGEAEVAKWLVDSHNSNLAESKTIASISGGLPGRAIQIMNSEKYFKLRKYIMDKIVDVIENKTASNALKASELLINRLKKDGEVEDDFILSELSRPEEVMELVADMFSDVMKYKVTDDKNMVKHSDQMSNVQELAMKLDVSRCVEMSRKALYAAEKIRARANARMVFDDFLLSLIA